MSSLHELVLESCHKYPYSIAVTYDDGSVIQTITYKELLAKSKEIVAVLDNFTIKNGVVGICVSESVHLPSLLLGILSSHVAFYYFDSGPVENIYNSITNIGVRYLLVEAEQLLELEEIIYNLHGCIRHHQYLPEWDLILIELLDVTEKKYNRLQVAYCITTSGTTGEPKIVRVPSQCIVPNILHLRKIYDMKQYDCVFLTSRLTFDPSIVDTFVTLSSGAELLIVPHKIKMMPEKLIEMIYYRHKVTVIQPTPSLISRITPHSLRTTILSEKSTLRILAFGGERFPSIPLLQSWREPGNRTVFINLYGITEVSSWAMYHVITEQDIRNQVSIMPLGKVLEKTEFIIKDLHGNVVTVGEGRLFVGSPYRYCLVGEETENCSQYMRATGDWVQIGEDKTVIFLYRIDDQIKRNGQRLNTSSIENVVLNIKTVQDCRVVYKDKRLILVVIPCSQEHNNKHLRQHVEKMIKNKLPSWYNPDHIVLLPVLPVTKHGKLDDHAVMGSCEIMDAEIQSMFHLLKKLWMESLMIESCEFSEDDNFLECGGDSLKAMALTDKLETILQSELPLLLGKILEDNFTAVLTYIKLTRSERTICSSSMQTDCTDELNETSEKFRNNNTENQGLVFDLKQDENFNRTDSLLDVIVEDGDRLKPYFNGLSDKLSSSVQQHPNQLYWIQQNEQSKRKYFDSEDFGCYCNKVQVCDKKSKISNNSVCERFEYTVSRGNMFNFSSVNKNCRPFIYHCNKISGLQECWKFDTKKCVDASPIVAVSRSAGSVLYIGSHSHKFYAISLDTGQEIWTSSLGDRIESTACLSRCGKYVIVGCYDYCLYVLKTSSGDIYWKYYTDGEVKSSPTVDCDTDVVYVGSHDQCLHALDIQKMSCIWKTFCEGGSVFSSPVVYGKRSVVYVATLGGNVLSVDKSCGSIKWTCKLGKPLFSTPCVGEDGVFIGCVDGKIHHINHIGQQVWQFSTKAPIFSIPVYSFIEEHPINTNCLMFGSHDTYLYCLEAQSGKELWKFKADHPIYSTPFIFMITDLAKSTNAHIWGTDCDFNLCGYCGHNNQDESKDNCVVPTQKKRTPRLVKTNDDIAECIVCCCSTKGTVYLLNSKTGHLVHQYTLPGEVFSSPIFVEGKLIVGCRDDYVYCLNILEDPG